MLAAAVAAAVLAFCRTSTHAQSNCTALLHQKITASGAIQRIIDLETFVNSVSFLDSKTGCQLTLLEGLLNPSCEEGRTITVTGIVMRNPATNGFEIEPERSGTAACR